MPWLILLVFNINLAYSASQSSSVKGVTLAELEQRTESVKEKQNLAEDLKNRILAAYQESADNLREAESQEQQADALKRSSNNIALEFKQVQRQILEAENSLKNRKPEKLVSIPTDELEQRLVIEKTRLSDLDGEIVRTQGLINDLTTSPQLIREKLAGLKTKQLATQQEQQLLATKVIDNFQEKEARQIQLDTRLRTLNSTQKALELENIGNPFRLELQKNHLQLLGLQRDYLTAVIAELDNYLLDRRQQEIDKEQAELVRAEKEAEGKHTLIREATKDNMRYNRSLQEVNKRIEQYLTQKNELDSRNAQIEKDFQSAETKINLAGLSPALGNLLREQRRNLPQRKHFSSLIDNIQKDIATTSLEMYKLDDAKTDLTDIDQVLSGRLKAHLPPDIDPVESLRIRTELRMLLNDQKDLVTRLSAAYVEYARVLGDVDFTLQQMLNNGAKFGAYLDERLLWVPNAPVITHAYLQNIANSVAWFLGPRNWLSVVDDFRFGIESYPVMLFFGFMIVGVHLRFYKELKTKLAQLLQRSKANQYLASFSQTLIGLLYILLLSLTIPLFMVWVASVLSLNQGADGFTKAFVMGLLPTSLSLALLQFFYRMFKPEGIAELAFHWHQRTPRLLYNQLKWARFVIIPCVLVVSMASTNITGEHSQSLGRTAQILLMLTMSYVLHRLTHPKIGLGKNFYVYSTGWISRLGYVWYSLALLAPLVVIGFSVAGYYQSALELQGKLIVTLRLVFITALFHALALRWLTITKRQLAVENARKKRKQALEQANVSAGAEGGGFIPDEELLDISKINQQSDKLLTTSITVILIAGCWMIWRDILPALSIFEQVELWQHGEMVDGKEVVMPVTLVNLMIALFYAAMTYVFVSNFPALVDLLSVGQFAMTAGSRYALIQLARYLLVTIAFLAIANELGGSWSQVQWLVAALSVGLGFGLQEIFANMVSGIILLFERPIRVGDTVTVGNVTGRVCRIQMRATHIMDWDAKELVVPNKTIITDQLVNWTLTDTTTRVVLMVGVAYGSDVDLVERVLKEAVNSVPVVLKEPEPMVSFLNFGESSLDFRVCVYVREMGDRMAVTHELHKRFYLALQAHNIEIPFPQRDVHLRSVADGIMPI
ncbi:MAG: mechanosensitive ion channel domain-containing protein [Gammaproteobacteria bacterium]